MPLSFAIYIDVGQGHYVVHTIFIKSVFVDQKHVKSINLFSFSYFFHN